MPVTVTKKLSRLPIAPIMAVLFAGAAGALVLATPKWLLNKWVAASGLPSVLAAANPPLGLKAHILVAVAAASLIGIVTFIAALAAVRVLGRKRKARSFTSAPIEPFSMAAEKLSAETGRFDPTAPADQAPAAFARPPIFAERELGAPFMSEPLVAEDAQAAPSTFAAEPVVAAYSVPSYEAPAYDVQPSTVQDYAPVAQAPAFEELEAAAFNPFLNDAPFSAPEMPAFAPESLATDVVVEDELMLDAEQIADIPEPVAEQPSWLVAQETAPVVEAPVIAPVSVAPEVQEAEAPQVAPVAPQRDDEPSLADLMSRFETGIRRRQLSNLVASTSFANTHEASGAAADAALRDALGTLERLAATAR